VGSAFTLSLTPEIDLHRTTLYNWRVFAEIVNLIINEMLLSWNVKAYLFYNIFAGTQPITYFIGYTIADINIAKGSMLNQIACILKLRREAFVSGVVAALKKHLPLSNIETVLLFNPTIILGRLLPQRKYDLLTI
jgi:hypothetical protein